MAKETRYFRASVRKEGAIGQFATKDFAVSVTVQGSYHAMIVEGIMGIRAKGYEVHHILDHSTKRECL